MIFENLELDVKCTGTKPIFTAYLPSNSLEIAPDLKRKTIILCPGGGYNYTADREAEPVALKLAGEGFNVFILRYTCAPKKFPTQLCELATAVAKVRENATEWNVDTNKIILAGFSAGGHLVGSLGSLWHEDFLEDITELNKKEYKPNGIMFGYPVISTDKPHQGSFNNLLNENNDYFDKISIEKNVTENMPKSFIWHTDNDESVPVENSLLLGMAMKKHKIPLELHIFPNGPHGLSLANELTAKEDIHIVPNVEIWFDLFVKWLKSI